MTVSLVYSAIITLAAVVLGILLWQEHKRRKPYRPSAKPPAAGKRLLRSSAEAHSPTRKTRARIGKSRHRRIP